jgi:acetyl esterase/lipase
MFCLLFSRVYANQPSHLAHRVGGLAKRSTHLAIAPGMEDHGVWIEPVPELVVGEIKTWAATTGVEPARIPGYWLGRPGEKSDLPSGAPPAPGEKVVLAFHGGGYIVMSANPDDPTAVIAKGLLEHAPTIRRVFSVEYRLSSGPPMVCANPFPSALFDALAAYNYLVNVVGFKPEDIIFEGASAGGNLALALTRYLIENASPLANIAAAIGHSALTPPGRLLLLSPWGDMGTSHDRPPPPYLHRSDYYGNITDPSDAKYAQRAYTGALGVGIADTNRYLSPASKNVTLSFKGFSPTLIVFGGAEFMADSMRLLKDRMSAAMGPGQVETFEAPDGIHDFISSTWHEPERTEALIKIAEWLDAAK